MALFTGTGSFVALSRFRVARCACRRGTLYALLERAKRDGLVVAGETYTEGGRQRRDYALTERGRVELRAEAERLRQAADVVIHRFGASLGVAVAQ